MTVSARRWIEADPNEDIEELQTAIADFLIVTEESRDSTAEYQSITMANRRLNISQSFNGASDELARVLGRVIDDATMLVDFCNWVAALQPRGRTSA